MPIAKFNTREALANRRENKAARCGYRSVDGSWPVFRPVISPEFSICSDTRIYTIGSCFARNIERSLQYAGFNPTTFKCIESLRKQFGDLLYNEPQVGIFNRYTPPSIMNEAMWHLDSIDPVNALYRIDEENAWHSQIHMKQVRPYDEMVKVARLVHGHTVECLSADVIVITLGLLEAWYDRQRGIYLNEKPPGRLALDERFECHVLSFGECLESMCRYIEGIGRINPDVRFVLTVSPVTLATTMTRQDVRVQNSFSKSTLRAVAAELCSNYKNVSYFPSYEMATLSHRELVYSGDDIHIRQQFVDYITFTFLKHYLDESALSSRGLAVIAFSSALVQQDKQNGLYYYENFREDILAGDNTEELVMLFRYAELCQDKQVEKKATIRLNQLHGGDRGLSRFFGGW